MTQPSLIPSLAFFASLLLLAGCQWPALNEHFNEEDGKHVLANAKFDRVLIDSTGELQVYASMNRAEQVQGDTSQELRFSDPFKEIYLVASKESTDQFINALAANDSLYHRYRADTSSLLAIYGELLNTAASGKLSDSKVSLVTNKTVNGMHYHAYTMTGVYEKMPIFYLNGIYKSEHFFYHVMVWTLASRRELYEGIMKKMAESVQEESAGSQ
jgi:hypothetical protein